MDWTQEKINLIYTKALNQAAVDRDFRQELLDSPNTAISKLAGMDVPEDFSIRVIENDPAYFATIILPPFNSGDLSDDDLDSVAGGMYEQLDGCCGTLVGKQGADV